MNQLNLDNGLKEKATELGFHGIVANWDDLDGKDLEVIARLLDWEDEERQERSLKRRIKSARLGSFKPLCDFDWSWPESCDREQIEELVGLKFFRDAENIVLLGPNGVGKTMLGKNIANQALYHGHSVLFTTASAMLGDLASKDSAYTLARRFTHYVRPSLLCVDELGYLSYGTRHADLLFEVISRRYELKKPILITTNKAFSEWTTIFPNAACVVTLVDRLIHRSEIIQIKGNSYRLKESLQRKAEKEKKRKKLSKKTGKTQQPQKDSKNVNS